ncbi:MAG: hypothetical protein ABW168_00520 [Sedimenticola sp.]
MTDKSTVDILALCFDLSAGIRQIPAIANDGFFTAVWAFGLHGGHGQLQGLLCGQLNHKAEWNRSKAQRPGGGIGKR